MSLGLGRSLGGTPKGGGRRPTPRQRPRRRDLRGGRRGELKAQTEGRAEGVGAQLRRCGCCAGGARAVRGRCAGCARAVRAGGAWAVRGRCTGWRRAWFMRGLEPGGGHRVRTCRRRRSATTTYTLCTYSCTYRTNTRTSVAHAYAACAYARKTYGQGYPDPFLATRPRPTHQPSRRCCVLMGGTCTGRNPQTSAGRRYVQARRLYVFRLFAFRRGLLIVNRTRVYPASRPCARAMHACILRSCMLW